MDIMKKMFCQLNNKINSELKKKKKKIKPRGLFQTSSEFLINLLTYVQEFAF